jgi:hypothetical protein
MHRQVLMLRDSALEECIRFLRNCELNGRTVKATATSPLDALEANSSGRNTITYEARLLRAVFQQLYAMD